MKKSGYKSIVHLYVLLLIILCVTVGICFGMAIRAVSTTKPDGHTVLTRWPIDFTNAFAKQIIFADGTPQVTDAGLESLTEEQLWIQIVDEDGNEVFSYGRPASVTQKYSASELLELYKSGGSDEYTPFIGSIDDGDRQWTYIIGFPLKISKVTMYMNANRFSGGKPVLLILLGVAALLALTLGAVYGLWITRQLVSITRAIKQIASRTYAQAERKNLFGDVYDSLNALDGEIRSSDEAQKKMEAMREEWITNITHDLKTPLSPIKGYAELLTDADVPSEVKQYGETILSNATYAEALVNDLKLTYQLKNGMIPVHRQEGDLARLLKETVIEILNNPKYADRNIRFTGPGIPVMYPFDAKLFQRVFNNLLYNAIIHNPSPTEVVASLEIEDGIRIHICDNGKGMDRDTQGKLFDRYYRGTNTTEDPQGTGLGMAISKQIVELHGGVINVESAPDEGTDIEILLPKPK